MENQNSRSLPFCIAGALFVYMGFSRFIGGIVSSIINSAYYGLSMEYLVKRNLSFQNLILISLFIGIGIFLLIRKLPIVNTILFGCMATYIFLSIAGSGSYGIAYIFDDLFEFFGYTFLCLISLGVFTNFKALSKVWFLPIILFLVMKPIIIINNLISIDIDNVFSFVNLFSSITKTAILAIAIILLCKWYKKVIDQLKAE